MKRLLLMLICWGIGAWAFAQSQDPDINQYVFVEEEPQPINLKEVNQEIGYPDSARAYGIEGRVVARILIDEEGNYLKHKITSEGDTLLAQAVAAHLSDLKFTPAIQNGEPIKYWINIPFNFKLQQKSPQEEAIAYYTNLLEEDSENYMAYLQRGLQYLELQEYDRAQTDFDKSLSYNPAEEDREDSSVNFLFYTYYARAKTESARGEFSKSKEDLTQAIEIAEDMGDTDSLVANTLPNVYLDRGYSYYADSALDASLTDYEKALEIAPELKCDIYPLMADVLVAQDNMEAAVKAYDEMIACEPDDRLLYYSRGFYKMNMEDYTGAVADFRETASRNTDPNIRIAAYNSSAQANMEAGDYEAAHADLEKALNVNVLNAQSYYIRGLLNQAQDNTEAMCADLKKAISYGFEDQEPQKAQQVQQLIAENCGGGK